MGMSTHVVGFKPPDEKWKQMKAVWDACEEADTPVPIEVMTFFNSEDPDESGVEVESCVLKAAGAVTAWDDGESRSGYEIHVGKLPDDVKIVRVFNSY